MGQTGKSKKLDILLSISYWWGFVCNFSLNDFLIYHEIAEIDVFPKVQQGVK